jgi:hypothetical protein
MFVSLQQYGQKRRAGVVLVCGGWMCRHIRLLKTRTVAATKIAAIWRGYCARLNMWSMRQAVFKIAKWWDTIKTFQLCSDAIVEVLIEARMLKEQMRGEQAAKIQGAWRARRGGQRGIALMRSAALKIQCMYRCWKARKVVNFSRAVEGVNLKRYPSKMMVLMPDNKGRLTRSKPAADEQELNESKTKLIADLTKLPTVMRLDLEDAVSNLQGHFRYLASIKAAGRIQRLVRGQNERKKLEKMQNNAKKLQAWARARKACKQVRSMRAQIELIQASARGRMARKDLPARTPAASSAEEKPAEIPAETPAATSTEEKPAETPAAAAAEEKPAESPAADAVQEKPAETPAAEEKPAETPAATSTEEKPAETPAVTTTEEKPAETPAAAAAEEKPAETPAEEEKKPEEQQATEAKPSE